MLKFRFRGKHRGKTWVYGSLITADAFCCILEDEDKVHPSEYPYLDPELGVIDGNVTPVDPDTVTQYVGKKDRNGEPIYQGDIVRTYRRFRPDEPDEKLAVVASDSCLFRGILGAWFPQDTCDVEIVGNIWDSPELLMPDTVEWLRRYFKGV